MAGSVFSECLCADPRFFPSQLISDRSRWSCGPRRDEAAVHHPLLQSCDGRAFYLPGSRFGGAFAGTHRYAYVIVLGVREGICPSWRDLRFLHFAMNPSDPLAPLFEG